MKRVKRMVIDPESLVHLFQEGLVIKTSGLLPDDATVIRAAVNHETGNIELVIESLDYPVVDDGQVIPLCEAVQFERISL